MNARLSLLSMFVVLVLLLNSSAGASRLPGPVPDTDTPAAGAPAVVSYQGVVTLSGNPFVGTGYFKFAVVNQAGTTSYWSNDGTSTGGGQPAASVALAVAGGQFTVLLGDTSLPGMTQPLVPAVFSGTDRCLRVWFSTDGGTFAQLGPDRRVAAVPYALQAADADTLDGLHAASFQQDYAGMVVVAKTGGDYSTVQAAINSIAAAGPGTPYLVWVAPGVYTETVMLKPYVHLQGAGQDVTMIGSLAAGPASPPVQATLVLTRNTSVRDLTVRNGATAAGVSYRVALLAGSGVTQTLVANVTAQAYGVGGGGGTYNCGVAVAGPGTSVTLKDVTSLAWNAESNYGLYNTSRASATVLGGTYTGRGGSHARGIYNRGDTTPPTVVTLSADGVTASAEGGNYSRGLFNEYLAVANLRGGAFTARGGASADGILNSGPGAVMVADEITALGEGGTLENNGLNTFQAAATLRGGAFIARGGSYARGIYNYSPSLTLYADNITALGESSGDNNYGLYNSGGPVQLRGGAYTGRGGVDTRGIYCAAYFTVLTADNISVLAESGATTNYGMFLSGGTATLRGGSVTARGGTDARGIYVNASTTATVSQSTIEGAGNSIRVESGSVDASNTRLVGGAVYGSVTCTAVSRGTTFNAGGCP